MAQGGEKEETTRHLFGVFQLGTDYVLRVIPGWATAGAMSGTHNVSDIVAQANSTLRGQKL